MPYELSENLGGYLNGKSMHRTRQFVLVNQQMPSDIVQGIIHLQICPVPNGNHLGRKFFRTDFMRFRCDLHQPSEYNRAV